MCEIQCNLTLKSSRRAVGFCAYRVRRPQRAWEINLDCFIRHADGRGGALLGGSRGPCEVGPSCPCAKLAARDLLGTCWGTVAWQSELHPRHSDVRWGSICQWRGRPDLRGSSHSGQSADTSSNSQPNDRVPDANCSITKVCNPTIKISQHPGHRVVLLSSDPVFLRQSLAIDPAIVQRLVVRYQSPLSSIPSSISPAISVRRS